MSYMIEFKEDKFEELAECAEKMLRYGGKVMSCIDNMRSNHDDHEGRREERRDWREERYDERRRY